jgi:hypothetical protein
MVSVMEIVSEVSGRCVEKIDVSVGARTRKLIMLQEQAPEDSLLDKAAQDWYWRWEMVPGTGNVLSCLRVIENIISPGAVGVKAGKAIFINLIGYI